MTTQWEVNARAWRDYRDAGLAKVTPPLNVPEDERLPLCSQDLPKRILSEREYAITADYSGPQLVEHMKQGVFSAEEVTRAFLRRAALAQHATNCLTEVMWDEAIARARFLDSLPEPLGPLHGLPISVKEHQGMHVHGKKINCAYTAWTDRGSPFSPTSQILWDAGCVFYVRTNQPQTLQCVETDNHIYGRTVNPWNRDLSSGGSSGGEGALGGMRGSVLGIGSDIGGSVRVPAAACGLYGFKPTVNRLGTRGMLATMGGNEGIMATAGPISTDREGIELFMKTVLDGEPWRLDPALDSRPWQPVELKQPLKIGVMWTDGVVRPHPPITRALKHVVDECKAAGHAIVDWQPLDHDKTWDLYVRLLYPDGAKATRQPLLDAGEPILPLVEWITTDQPSVRELTMHEYWDLILDRDASRARYAAHWNANDIDILLCPAAPGVAARHETSKYWLYTCQWNFLDYPAVVFPTGLFVDEEVDGAEVGYVPVNETDGENWKLWAVERFLGAPIGLQIVDRRGRDEEVMAALKVVEEALGRA